MTTLTLEYSAVSYFHDAYHWRSCVGGHRLGSRNPR